MNVIHSTQNTMIIPKGLPVVIKESQRSIHFLNRTPWIFVWLINLRKKLHFHCYVSLEKRKNYLLTYMVTDLVFLI